MRSEMPHRYASVENAGNSRILRSNSSTVNRRTFQSRKINSMKWNWIVPQAVTGSVSTFIGFTCLLLFQILLQIKVTDGGCREQRRDPCESICVYDPQKIQHPNCTLRPVVLLPVNASYESSSQKVMPVLKIAEEHVKERQILPHYIKFDWRSYDDKCDSSLAAISAMDGYGKDCAHVYFGPSCEYPLASVSRITKYFRAEGTPLISNGGGTFDFQKPKTNCKDEYYMLIRTGMLSFQVISKAVTAVMKRYNWSQVVLFFERNGQYNVAGLHTCHLMVHTLAEIFRETGVIYSSFATDAGTGNWTEDLIREVGFDHSIVIMCADPLSIRQILLVAEELKMIDSGEYVFINIELFSRVPYVVAEPWYLKNDTEENNRRARKAYTALLTVTAKQPDDEEYLAFSDELKKLAAQKYNYTFQQEEPVSTFVTSFYDAVLLYAYALNESITEDPAILLKPINGSDMVRRMWNRSFRGITGNVTIDANGDRISAYSLLDMNPDTGRFEVIAHFLYNRLEFVAGKSIHWAGGKLEPPLDKPICGFDGSLCPDNSLPGYAILSLVLGFTVIIMAIISILGYRHYKAEAEINSMTWKINRNEVLPCDSSGKFRASQHSLPKRGSEITFYSEDMGSFAGDRQIFIPLGLYRGCKVAIKPVDERNVSITRSLMLELKRMKDIQHDHLVKFFGACLDPPKCFILSEYCPKGSLQDILENDQIKLDWMFKLSLMHDIVRGMHFLHQSDIRSHGNLKSSNCVVDSRFVLKVTDFGLHVLRKPNCEDDIENSDSYAHWKRLLWTAPELLRMENPPLEGTQKGDVYSFGIIVHEIITRQGPFYLGESNYSPQEIIQQVKSLPKDPNYPFRPKLKDSKYEEIDHMMLKCWSEEPFERPDFALLKTIIRKINKDNETGNIVDNLLQRMEQYANNLEGLVEERTRDYLEEKKKCEKLLYQLLPQTVAAQLISGQPVIAETFDQVTIYFSDIVGFTAISAESTPMQVVNFLNDLYTCFDSIVENFDVYKVETIGDAYMVVSGLPIRNGNLHAREIARMSLALLKAVYSFKIRHRPNDQLKLRIGLHSGSCVAGVVGLKMPRYCLFGDTVNTASRMESNGEALKIHISHTTKIHLDEFETFIITKRGIVPMKGKGEMLTYWLEGEKQLPKSKSLISVSSKSVSVQDISSSSHKVNGDFKTEVYSSNRNVNETIDENQLLLTRNGKPSNFIPNHSSNPNLCSHREMNERSNNFKNSDDAKHSSSNLNFNNIIKSNNIKNLKIKCSNSNEDNVKSVTQPLLGKINS